MLVSFSENAEVGKCIRVVMVNKSRLNRRGTGDFKRMIAKPQDWG